MFVTAALADEADVRIARWMTDRGPAAALHLGTDIQLVATGADPAALRALAAALTELAEWREQVIATGRGVAA